MQGHAGYAESGSDIVCAAASVLAQNAVNSIEQFTEDTFTVDVNEDLGELYFKIDAGYSHETELLLNSLILGLQGIEEELHGIYRCNIRGGVKTYLKNEPSVVRS